MMFQVVQRFFSRLLRRFRPPLLIICGPTASGKTSFSIELAMRMKEQGRQLEIISADSRQIYKEIPVFSGAITTVETGGIPHHLVGTEPIAEIRTAQWFREQSRSLIQQIHSRGNTPVVVGGAAFWIQNMLQKQPLPEVPPDTVLRTELETLPLAKLQQRLHNLDLRYYQQIDQQNKRRLIRAIEIISALGQMPPVGNSWDCSWNTKIVYFDYPQNESDKKIQINVIKRIAKGMYKEAKKIHEMVSAERWGELGLAYKHLEDYWQGALDEEELTQKIVSEEVKYAKRQRTFFKKMLAKKNYPTTIIQNLEQRSRCLDDLATEYL